MQLIGAVDIGGSKIAAAIVTSTGQVLARRFCATQPERGFADALARIETMLCEMSRGIAPLSGIGVGCPGPLDPATGVLGTVGTLPGWQGSALAEQLASRFQVSVAVENDADAAALAEYHWGAAGAASSFIYIAVSTGIGGGIILNGRLYRGVGGAHPELGHQIIDPTGPPCYCGAHGCWESLASGTAMSTWMQSVEPAIGTVTAKEICHRATQGDPLAQRAVKRVGYYLGLGLANLVTLFTPEKVALGGGVMASPELFLETARQVARQLCTQVPAQLTSIESAYLGADVGLLGAAQCWLQRYGRLESAP